MGQVLTLKPRGPEGPDDEVEALRREMEEDPLGIQEDRKEMEVYRAALAKIEKRPWLTGWQLATGLAPPPFFLVYLAYDFARLLLKEQAATPAVYRRMALLQIIPTVLFGFFLGFGWGTWALLAVLASSVFLLPSRRAGPDPE